MKKIILSASCLSLLLALVSCSSTGSYTSNAQGNNVFSGEIEVQNLRYEGIRRNPVIIVHGFLGANLKDKKTNKKYWGEFSVSDAFYVSDDRIKTLAHPMVKNKKLSKIDDTLIPDGMLQTATIRILGVSIKQIAYKNLVNILTKAGYQPESRPMKKDKHFNSLFEFAYDWRQDLPQNARILDAFIKQKRKYMQKKYKELYGIENYDVQFDIIAHSMGGLLSRYYLRYGTQDLPSGESLPILSWAGRKYLDRLVIVGTPNAGYLDTFLEILHGSKLQAFPSAVLSTLPTFYQMFPAPSRKSIVYSDNNEPVDVFDPKVWVKMKWGLVNPEEDKTLKILLPNIKTKKERFDIAYDHLAKCLKRAKRFIKAMAIKATPPEDVKLYLVLGHGIKTSRKAYVNRNDGSIEKIIYAPGDGKITSTSALYDERAGQEWSNFINTPITWSQIIALRAAHMGIIESPAFEDNIVLALTMEETTKQRVAQKTFKEIKPAEKQ